MHVDSLGWLIIGGYFRRGDEAMVAWPGGKVVPWLASMMEGFKHGEAERRTRRSLGERMGK